MRISPGWIRGLGVAVVSLAAGLAVAQDFDRDPINYSTSTPQNAISRLQQALDAGDVTLEHDSRMGYLPAVLKALQVPVSSQTLVYSKTSLQRQRISPRTPRALYFSDDVYIGYCQSGDVVEVSVADPGLGTVFYLMEQEAVTTPRFQRQIDNCLQCHGTTHTRGVPGHIIRSVYSDRSGFPVLAMGTYRIDHTSPLARRWGGWYVTGTHGKQQHLGNLVVDARTDREPVDNSAGQNLTSLDGRFDAAEYLSPHSDLVALMVLEHQAEAHNLLSRASFQSREALYAEEQLNRELGEPATHRWESTTVRLRSACDALVKYLLFCDEASLEAPLVGTSGFTQEFPRRGPRDAQGRSLRDLDLQRRLFRYPCSYLIYSPSFDALPLEMREMTYQRLWKVLTGADTSPAFAHLSAEDRLAIRQILVATKSGLPDYWTAEEAAGATP